MIQSATQATAVSLPQNTQRPDQAKADSQELTAEQKSEVQKLKQRNREVRNHEQAHLAAGGQHITRGATYSYEQGPDGQRYAVGGEVGIDTSAESDPAATIRKMQAARAAALAPANPSGQDRQVAAAASSQAAEARAALAAEQVDPEEKTKTAADYLPTAAEEAPLPGTLVDIRA